MTIITKDIPFTRFNLLSLLRRLCINHYTTIVTLFLLELFILSHHVYANDVFSIPGIHVKTQEKNAVLAKKKAHEVAQRKALKRLYLRIVPYQYLNHIPEIESDILPNLIQNFSVENEVFSQTNYEADFIIHFNDEIIEDFLNEAGIPYEIKQSKTNILIPLYLSPHQTIQFSTHNSWFKTWQKLLGKATLVPIRIPSKNDPILTHDLLRKLASQDNVSLTALQRHYQNDNVIIVLLRPKGDAKTFFDVVMFGHNTTGKIHYTRDFTVKQSNDAKHTLQYAANIFLKVLEYRWQKTLQQKENHISTNNSQIQTSEEESIDNKDNEQSIVEIIAEFHNYKKWLKIHNALINNFGEDKVIIKAITSKTAYLELTTDMKLKRIIYHLNKENLNIEKKNHYVVIR